MSSVVFNSFKQRFLNGEVPHDDVWKFIPVNKSFTQNFGQDDFPLEQYRNLDDFYDHNYDAMNNSYFEGIKRDIYWYKPADTDDIHKPMFITSGSIGEKGKYDERSNWEDFQKTVYMKDISGNSAIPSYLASGGFYYIRKKDELRWFAARANTGNNRIIGVLGDGIDGVIRGQVGSNEDYPFQGILDGNGHTLNAVSIVCDSTDNGLVGVLGCDGIVKNFKITNDVANSATTPINLLCEKRIDLNHIKTDGRDINAGILVGRNYGRIENIDGSQLSTFKFSGFVPQVYSVTNKSDEYKDFYATVRPKYDNGENFYFLNSWCINSPGNICPYVGYFAEGLFAQSARGYAQDGGVTKTIAIEHAPALKSKYDAGLCDVTLKLESKCSKIGLYVKPSLKEHGDDTIWERIKDNPIYVQNLDPNGTNCVMFVGFTTKDEAGKDVTYVLEMNGTAYDKKSGTGKRRYYFHCGHYDFKKHISALSKDTYDHMDDDVKDFYVPAIDGEDNCKVEMYMPFHKEYDNGEDDSNEETNSLDAEDYTINDEDIKVFTSDGIPAKIKNKEIDVLFFAPRNKDTSTHVWETITWIGYVKEHAVIEFEATIQLLDGDSVVGEQTCHFTYTNNDEIEIEDFFGEDDDDPWKDPSKFSCQEGHDMAALFEQPQNRCVILTAFLSEFEAGLKTDKYTRWKINDEDDLVNGGFAGEFIVDDQDRRFFERYFQNRARFDDTWVENVTFDGIHSYDILVNSDNGIRSEGTIDITLLTVGRFQYRPFVHASPTDTVPELGGKYYTYDDDYGPVNVNPGTKMYLVSAYYNQFTTEESAAVQNAFDYFIQNSKLYIDNPIYYGMDRNGYWTSNVVRPDPENDPWKYLSANRESWLSTLNFNWNIMQKMFETDNNYYTELTKYAKLDDGDDPIYYGDLDFADEWYRDSDLPHALLNKPIRMHNMARAAYYVSPIAGANYGHIKNVIVSSDRENVGNFVGFVGSLAGKQERGLVESARVFADDKFTYFAATPTPPSHDNLTDEQYNYMYDEYEKQKAAYNFQVRYKQTPIMPSAVSEAISDIGENPDDNWQDWKYYPAEAADTVDEEYIQELIAEGKSVKEYLDDLGVKMYYEKSSDTQIGDVPVVVYTENPNYKFEKMFYDSSAPIRAYTSAWYDDYKTTATEHFDDVITYNLRPIFNAGGCFGKIVPTYNANKIELSGGAVKGTVLHHIDVHYILDDAVKYSAFTAADPAGVPSPTDLIVWNSKDIHNTYGAIAGLVELQTSQVGSFDYGDKNAINMGNINVSSEGNAQPGVPLTPFGFLAYQPTDLNTVQATCSSPRQKNGDWYGEYTETTWALDAPVVINNKMWYSKNNYAFAPINQSSGAFFMIGDLFRSITDHGHSVTNEVKQEYFQKMVNKLFKPSSGANGDTVNIDGKNLIYCNYDAFDFAYGRRGSVSIQSCFGSNVSFEPVIGYGRLSKYPGTQETLDYKQCTPTRIYEMTRYALSADDEFNVVTNYSPVNVDTLSYPSIFVGKGHIDDRYFDYTYRETTSFIDDWTFVHNVIFTSALKEADRYKPGNADQKATLGYVFRDPMNYSADGFRYDYNYLHIGNSVSPAYIRDQIKEPGSELHTSACSGAYYDENGELVSAKGDHDFGGLLVVDGQDRTVMFIDNTNGAKIDGGSWNMACERVTYQGNSGGLLLEVK